MGVVVKPVELLHVATTVIKTRYNLARAGWCYNSRIFSSLVILENLSYSTIISFI